MHPELRTLYNLQLADTHIRHAEKQIQTIDRGEKVQAAIRPVRSQAASLAMEKARHEKELQETEKALSAAQQRIRQTESRLSSGAIHNVHEMESSEKELQTFRARAGDLEEKALGLMETLEGVPARAAALLKQERMLTQQFNTLREEARQTEERLRAEIQAVQRRRQSLAAELSPAALKQYEGMASSKGGVAVVRVVSGACDACHVSVPPHLVKLVVESLELVHCLNCSRFLYTE